MGLMGTELTRLHYVSCPSCHTMFKPREIPTKLSDKVHCICCAKTFTIEQSNNLANTKSQKSRKANKLPTITKVQKNTTDQYLKKYKLKSKALFLTWSLMPIALLAILANLVYQNKNDLAQDEYWRPFIAKFCNIMNCELPSYNNLAYVLVEDNAMVSAPEKDGTIQLFAMLKNIGKFDQTYPDLHIKFTDINGRIITEKNISPKEYLNQELTSNSKLAKNSKEYISMLIKDPGPDAINYEIALK